MILGAVLGGAAGAALVPTTSELSIKRQVGAQSETPLKPMVVILGSSLLGAAFALTVAHFGAMQVQKELNERQEDRRKSQT